MPSQADIEAALNPKAADGKIKVADVLAALSGLGVAADKVEPHLNEKKDGDGNVDLAEIVAFIAAL